MFLVLQDPGGQIRGTRLAMTDRRLHAQTVGVSDDLLLCAPAGALPASSIAARVIAG
jgi:hypothetical protein